MAPEPQFPPLFHASWPEPARQLLQRAIARHGGWALWSRLQAVTVSRVSLSGLLPWMKGYRRSFDLPRTLTAYPKLGRVDWGERDQAPVGGFEQGDVWGPGAKSLDHRQSFRGLRKLRRWSTLDALFFFGYAFASYTAMPFALPGLRFVRALAGRWRGEKLMGVRVEFPAGAEVHSRLQSYFFDDSGLLRRNDYVADVVGGFARGAHGWDDYVTVDGWPMPTRRTVVFRLGGTPIYFPAALRATFDGLAVRFASAAAATA